MAVAICGEVGAARDADGGRKDESVECDDGELAEGVIALSVSSSLLHISRQEATTHQVLRLTWYLLTSGGGYHPQCSQRHHKGYAVM